MNPYLGIVMLLGLAAGFVTLTIITSMLVGPGRYNRASTTHTSAASNRLHSRSGAADSREVLHHRHAVHRSTSKSFLYPWAVSFDQMGTFALIEMILFIATVFVAYVYVLREVDSIGTDPARNEAWA